ncbi:MAG TPA: gliding motility-associated ABC transporter permease subunit GldF [Bacteroidales bacterium]|jgi:ABC-2 type transport system permease protein|nr:gliding motility-associated ABC transporter permease subunit GldF [Bacteroidales bacterium]MDD4235014.1 gliding motility-associated ABC transporter permease subunit GldF [Bacteroidales bacterium]MDY0161318.1 gliding motility-associated ABC transporter permease subunit GldF [Bacteroidales bacterium]HRW20739.1 gliding motility-associated ABC transporter permease subunit GldF [Bacteroidales bacterium]HXK81166.1 gliding motility-associated ABC transporter permease subunit GldF [Bacteroidales bac
MWTLFFKEIRDFFSSITGYVVVLVFLLITSMFLWIFHSNFNIFDAGYANLDSLFILAPWIFLFLIPAVNMRMFAEEKRSGTSEWLLTKPLSEFKIIMAKYLAGVFLSLIALLPTLFYLISVYLFADPVGNFDFGGFAGSFIGLLFLAAVYTAISLFASSITKNQIIAFFISVLLCYVFFLGFDQFAGFAFKGGVQSFIMSLGISDHYRSMSRGVIDSRDLVYFLSIITLFIYFTKLSLISRKW